jgi:ferredoxin
MKLIIDASRCQGHAMCQLYAPDLVELNDEDGHARSRDQDLDDGQLEQARKAVAACPEGAVSLE